MPDGGNETAMHQLLQSKNAKLKHQFLPDCAIKWSNLCFVPSTKLSLCRFFVGGGGGIYKMDKKALARGQVKKMTKD